MIARSKGVGLQPLACWDFRFQSHRGYGRVVLCQSFSDEMITRPGESYRLWCVIACDLETSWMRRPWPTGGAVAPKTDTEGNGITRPLYYQPSNQLTNQQTDKLTKWPTNKRTHGIAHFSLNRMDIQIIRKPQTQHKTLLCALRTIQKWRYPLGVFYAHCAQYKNGGTR